MAKKPPAAQTNDQTQPTTDKKRSRGNFPHVIQKRAYMIVCDELGKPKDSAAPVDAWLSVISPILKNNVAGRKYIEATFDDGEYQVVQIKSTARVETETVKKKVLK